MNCNFITRKLNETRYIHTCQVCGFSIESKFEKLHYGFCGNVKAESEIKKRKSPCAHLETELRREECDGCRGKVMVKIYQCELHGECINGRITSKQQAQFGNIKSCCDCEDYKESN